MNACPPRAAARTLCVTLAAIAVVGAVALSSQTARAESPRSMMLELHVGAYTPNVDSQFADAQPWQDIFGTKSMTLLRMHLDYQLWQAHGSLAIGGGIGYGWITGNALDADGEFTQDEVGFKTVPMTASLVYRWDWPAVRFSFPLVPYLKAGLTAVGWWTTNARGEIANVRGPDGKGRVGQGITFGWHAGGGLQFLLDILSPGMAREFDNEVGVNNSYIFAEFMYSDVSDFGSDSSIRLGDTAFSFGLMFEF